MKPIRALAIISIPALLAWNSIGNWVLEEQKGYTIQYTAKPSTNQSMPVTLLKSGLGFCWPWYT